MKYFDIIGQIKNFVSSQFDVDQIIVWSFMMAIMTTVGLMVIF